MQTNSSADEVRIHVGKVSKSNCVLRMGDCDSFKVTDIFERKVDLPNFSFYNSRIREAGGVRNNKMPLVPCRVIPHIFFQKILHKLQLVVPKFILLEVRRQNVGKAVQATTRAPSHMVK